jgi:hypothetical protein
MASAAWAVKQFLTENERQTQASGSATSQRDLLSAQETQPEGRRVLGEHVVEIRAARQDVIPAWVLSTSQAMAELLQLPAGWNSYHARPVKLSSVQSALELLNRIMTDPTPAPDVVPTSPGGVQLEWHTTEIDVEITIPPSGLAEVYVCRPGAGSIEGPLPQVLSDLQVAIAQLSAAPSA